MADNQRISPDAIEALRARFELQSRKAQAFYTVMHEARSVTGTDDAAGAWMNEPLSAFAGKSPAQLVAEGRADDVLAYIASLRR